MTREQLEHIIRASAVIADDDEVIIVGSQSILGAHPDAPESLLASDEADVYPKNHPERADLIDGSIGELSPFHDTFGYYAQGVGRDTATLPSSWEQRLVAVRTEATRGATGWCLEPNDLALAKLVAGRDKDLAFVREMAIHGLIDTEILRQREISLNIAESLHQVVRSRIDALSGA
jgi:hypothetical protein